jgi:hypothetical protein
MSAHALLLGCTAALVAGGRDLAGAVLALLLGASFLPTTAAVSVLSHPRMAAPARRRLVILGAAGVALGLLVLAHGPAWPLVWVAAVGAPVGALYMLTRGRFGARSVPTQLCAIAGISLLAPTAWLLIAGDRGPWILAGPAAFLSFGGTVPYVRERVRRRRQGPTTLPSRLRGGAVAIVWQIAALGSAIAVVPTAGWLLPVAYLPGATKTVAGIAMPERRPPIKRIGYLETAISSVFAMLAGIALGAAA